MILAVSTHHGNPSPAALTTLTAGALPFDESTGSIAYNRESNIWAFTGVSATVSLSPIVPNGTYSITGTLAGSPVNPSIAVLNNGVEVTSYDFSGGPAFDLSFEASDTSGLELAVSADSGAFSLAGLRAYRSSVFVGDPIPPNTETETAQQAVAPQTSGNSFSPPTGALFDGNENTFVQYYTYASGGSSATFDPPISFKAIEFVGSGTPGYSGEAGLFGGTALLQVDGETVITAPITATNDFQRWRVTQDFDDVSEIRVVKPGGQRFRAREILIYT